MNRRPTTKSIALLFASSGLVAVLGSVAAATSDSPATPGPAAYCDDPAYLPSTPDSAEKWLAKCP